ncbi:MAG: long-chain fatty acid--CoA ligase [Actinomycetota bacterium]
MLSTMQDFPLTLRMILEHGSAVHPDAEVVTWTGGGARRLGFAVVAERAARLAGALRRLGIEEGDRVATFQWNSQEHLEAYFAVPCMGAVLHTLNLRLFPDQLTYVVNHAEDRVVIVDDTLVPLLARVAPALRTVEHVVVVGQGDASALGDVLRYEDLLAAEEPRFPWPGLDERAAAAMCYTTGTTGDPKGVVYSHRSSVLHSYGLIAATGLHWGDRALPVVPMFHANAWGLPYASWFVGADLLMPGRFLQAADLAAFIAAERPTLSGAVPTIWGDLLRHLEANPTDLSSLRSVIVGGSAVPRSLAERFEQRHGVRVVQGWGMTETHPVATVANPPRRSGPDDDLTWRLTQGRILPGIELRVTDDAGDVLPWDGTSVGEIEVRGPWVTARYHKDDAPEKFHDGWLRTGDVGTVDDLGYVRITDRSKDIIKSGGEWISSVDLENAIMGHADVVEAAVIGVPDERWQERPLACIVLAEGSAASPSDLRAFLAGRVAKWWLPERWAFVGEIPKTSVGKFDKRALRNRRDEGGLEIIELEPTGAGA